MKIRAAQPCDAALEAFIAAHPDANGGHDPAWPDILMQAMRHRPASLIAERDGQIVGYLPLALTHSWLFGRFMTSLPYVNEAGLLCDEPATAEALIGRATAIADKHQVGFIELRNAALQRDDGLIHVRQEKVHMSLALPADEDALWKTIHSKARNLVRKAQKQNLAVHFGGRELLDAFYHVFAINMRDLGSPAFPKKLFALMIDRLTPAAELCVVYQDDTPIAGAILTHFRSTTEVPSASSLREYNKTCANMLMYWHLLRHAQQRGSDVFEFGRCNLDSPTFKFKKQWSAEPRPTAWQHLQRKPQVASVTKEDAKYRKMIEMWQRLPVWVTRLAGPRVVRGIP